MTHQEPNPHVAALRRTLEGQVVAGIAAVRARSPERFDRAVGVAREVLARADLAVQIAQAFGSKGERR